MNLPSAKSKRDVRYQLTTTSSSLLYENMAGPFVVERIEVMGEFATREAARQYMLDTEAERKERDNV